MAKRDPNKTARNKQLSILKQKRRSIVNSVLLEIRIAGIYKYNNEAELNAFIGSKANNYIDLQNAVISTPLEYINLWIIGLKKTIDGLPSNSLSTHMQLYKLLKGNFPKSRQYIKYFLESSFLKHYEEHYKVKPKINESEYWFGNNNDEFGILVTPRYRNTKWENDKSEIRHFMYPYWTLGHVMDTGLCYMNENKIRNFDTLREYLSFFRDMVRRTGSKYQTQIANNYIDYVNLSKQPLSIPILIPELRYDPFKNKHKYRLDFTIINPWSMEKIGFEISPSSTHMKLKGKNKTVSEMSKQAYDQFQKEMSKHKNYWKKYGINYITFTNKDLSNIIEVWSEIKKYLEISEEPAQLQFDLIKNLLE